MQVFLSAPDRIELKRLFLQTRTETTKNIAWELKVVQNNLYWIYLVIIELIPKNFIRCISIQVNNLLRRYAILNF